MWSPDTASLGTGTVYVPPSLFGRVPKGEIVPRKRPVAVVTSTLLPRASEPRAISTKTPSPVRGGRGTCSVVTGASALQASSAVAIQLAKPVRRNLIAYFKVDEPLLREAQALGHLRRRREQAER